MHSFIGTIIYGLNMSFVFGVYLETIDFPPTEQLTVSLGDLLEFSKQAAL
jgi:hypothetical protein